MSWDGHKLATATMRDWHGGRLPVGVDEGATMTDEAIARQTAETRAARRATRLRGVTAREADVRLAEAVADAQHTAMVGAGRGATMADPEDGAQQAGATHPDAYGRLLRESTRLREERAALRAAVARLEGENAALRGAFERNERARDILRDGVDSLSQRLVEATAQRDEARAALALLVSDAELAWHDYHNLTRHAGRREECNLEICRGLRRAVARARAASEGGER